MAGLLLLWYDLGNGDEDFHGQQPHAVLVILDEVLKEGYHFVDDDGGRHLLDQLGEVGGRLAADHRRLIVDQQAKLLAELFLDRCRHLLVGGGVETTARDLGREPICLGEPDGKRNKVFFDLLRREVGTNLVEGFDGLPVISRRSWRAVSEGTSITLSRTTGSSMAARFSSGDNRTWPH